MIKMECNYEKTTKLPNDYSFHKTGSFSTSGTDGRDSIVTLNN